MNNTVKAHLALFGAALIYGLNYIIAKDVMPNYVQPFGFILLRVLGALILFWTFFGFKNAEKIDRNDYVKLAICGLFGVATNQLLFFKGLNETTPINASIIMTTNPILVLLLSAFFLKERINISKIVGITLGLTGTLMILFLKGDFNLGSNTLSGDICIFLNSLSYGIYLILVKPLMLKYKATTVIKWVFLFGSVVVIPVGFQEFTEINWEGIPLEIYGNIFYVIICTTFLAYLFNIYALKRVNPSVVSTYIYLQPLIATFAAISLSKDSLSLIKVLSAMLIFIGVYLVSLPSSKKLTPSE